MPDLNIILMVVLALLVGLMFWNSRKRMQKMKEEQAAKARQTVPGAEVMLNSGLFGTIVSYDPDNLDQPAEVEIAPGVVIKVHSQAIARIISSEETSYEDETDADVDVDADEDMPVVPDTPASLVETEEETRRRLEGDSNA